METVNSCALLCENSTLSLQSELRKLAWNADQAQVLSSTSENASHCKVVGFPLVINDWLVHAGCCVNMKIRWNACHSYYSTDWYWVLSGIFTPLKARLAACVALWLLCYYTRTCLTGEWIVDFLNYCTGLPRCSWYMFPLQLNLIWTKWTLTNFFRTSLNISRGFLQLHGRPGRAAVWLTWPLSSNWSVEVH